VSRPADWAPLAGSDPTPGDPVEVGVLANRYRDTADEISRQAGNLRKLASGSGEGWDSDAGRVFHDHATELAGKIEKAHHRYEAAAGALRGFVSPLELAQRQADLALVDAKAAAADMASHAAQPAPSVPAGTAPTPPTPEQQSAEHRRQASYDDASGRLAAARRRMEDAHGDYDHAASTAGKAIRDVIDHDDVHDGFWDKVGSWIHEHAGIIKLVLKVVGYIVTVLAIAALIIALFIPGLNILVLGVALTTILEVASVVGTVALLVGHTALASTGDGSWLDVGLDLVALATFGVGKALTAGAEGTASAARSVAAETAAGRASEASLSSTRLPRTLYGLADRVPILRSLVSSADHLQAYEDAASGAAALARSNVLALAPETTALQRVLFAGDAFPARLAQLRAVESVVPGVPEVAAATSAITHAGVANAIMTDGGMVLDGSRHVAEDLFGLTDVIEPTFTAPLIHLP
jgi:uncharacterized protein YukE